MKYTVRFENRSSKGNRMTCKSFTTFDECNRFVREESSGDKYGQFRIIIWAGKEMIQNTGWYSVKK